jgi:hypothetical protein
VSERNGDKARFGRLRKHKILLRKRTREFRKKLENKATRTTAPALDRTMSLPLEPTG